VEAARALLIHVNDDAASLIAGDGGRFPTREATTLCGQKHDAGHVCTTVRGPYAAAKARRSSPSVRSSHFRCGKAAPEGTRMQGGGDSACSPRAPAAPLRSCGVMYRLVQWPRTESAELNAALAG